MNFVFVGAFLYKMAQVKSVAGEKVTLIVCCEKIIVGKNSNKKSILLIFIVSNLLNIFNN
jgi:hypothetical protein